MIIVAFLNVAIDVLHFVLDGAARVRPAVEAIHARGEGASVCVQDFIVPNNVRKQKVDEAVCLAVWPW